MSKKSILGKVYFFWKQWTPEGKSRRHCPQKPNWSNHARYAEAETMNLLGQS
jgi:hypothetical protein